MASLLRVDHTGYLARDLDGEVARYAALGLPVVRLVDLPQFGDLHGKFLGPGTGEIEIFTFADEALLDERLNGEAIVLDHVAYEVDDVRAVGALLAAQGVRFTTPDRSVDVDPAQPVELAGGSLHLWAHPSTNGGHGMQLLQKPAA